MNKDDCECGVDEKGNWSDKVFDRYGCGCETMILFKGELPLDHTKSIEHLVELWTQDLINHYTDTPFSNNYDACHESAWAEIEEEFYYENLIMEHVNND